MVSTTKCSIFATMTNYDDIIDLPHYTPKNHQRMLMHSRAAQFAPFAALTGHDAMIKETARITDSFIERDDETNTSLNSKINQLIEHIAEHPEITVIYFLPDSLKKGGSYQSICGRVKNIDEIEKKITFLSGEEVNLSQLLEIYL